MSGVDLTHYYSVLLLEPGAPLDQVKQAFRSLSRKWHPDQYISDPGKHRQALDRQTRLNEAYAALCKAIPREDKSCSGTASGGMSGNSNAAGNRSSSHNSNSRATGKTFTSPPDCGLDLDTPSAYIHLDSMRTTLLDELIAQGRRHEKGEGCTKDSDKAAGYYRQAARMGSASACFRLACIYMNSNAESANQKLAAEYFQQAVNCGHVASCFNLALMYERGVGVKKDLKKAIDLYRMAASAGDKQARARLEKLTNVRVEAKPGLSSTFGKVRDCYAQNG